MLHWPVLSCTQSTVTHVTLVHFWCTVTHRHFVTVIADDLLSPWVALLVTYSLIWSLSFTLHCLHCPTHIHTSAWSCLCPVEMTHTISHSHQWLVSALKIPMQTNVLTMNNISPLHKPSTHIFISQHSGWHSLQNPSRIFIALSLRWKTFVYGIMNDTRQDHHNTHVHTLSQSDPERLVCFRHHSSQKLLTHFTRDTSWIWTRRLNSSPMTL